MLAILASRAHGVVSARELRAAGITRRQIEGRVASGLLIPEFPGVYRVGHRAPSAEARYMAAVKACGAGAMLSGLAAAWSYVLIRSEPPAPEVTCPSNRRVNGVRTCWSRRLDAMEATTWKRIPITTVPRTLVDIAAQLRPDALARAVHEADVRYGTRPEHVEALLARYPNAPGARVLRAIISGDSPLLLSRLEQLFLALLRSHCLPLPETNRRRGAHYVDCRWPKHRLTVELDSYRFHRSRRSWEQDRERERAARRRGDRFRRYTWRDVVEEPAPTVTELSLLLSE